MWHKIFSTCLAILCTVMLAGTALASSTADDALFKEVTQEIVCTCGCGNQLLSDCVCGMANKWKSELRLHIKSGKKKEQLLKLMADKYGPEVLAAPPKEGLNWILWVVVPYILPVVSAFILWWFLRKWVAKRKISPSEDDSLSVGDTSSDTDAQADEYKKRLEDELKDFDD